MSIRDEDLQGGYLPLFAGTELVRRSPGTRVPVSTILPTVAPPCPVQLSGLVLWLDAEATPTVQATAGRVHRWKDRSGHAHDGTQSLLTYKPATASRGVDFGVDPLGFLPADFSWEMNFGTYPLGDILGVVDGGSPFVWDVEAITTAPESFINDPIGQVFKPYPPGGAGYRTNTVFVPAGDAIYLTTQTTFTYFVGNANKAYIDYVWGYMSPDAHLHGVTVGLYSNVGQVAGVVDAETTGGTFSFTGVPDGCVFILRTDVNLLTNMMITSVLAQDIPSGYSASQSNETGPYNFAPVVGDAFWLMRAQIVGGGLPIGTPLSTIAFNLLEFATDL